MERQTTFTFRGLFYENKANLKVLNFYNTMLKILLYSQEKSKI